MRLSLELSQNVSGALFEKTSNTAPELFLKNKQYRSGAPPCLFCLFCLFFYNFLHVKVNDCQTMWC